METLLSRRELQDVLNISRATFFRRLKEPDFPAPIEVGKQSLRWRPSAIDAWLESRTREKNGHADLCEQN